MNQICNQTDTLFLTNTNYRKAETAYIEELKSKERSNQEIKNTRTAIQSWLTTFNLDSDSIIGEEFEGLYQENTTKYKVNQQTQGIKKVTYTPRLSLLNGFRKFYVAHKSERELPASFAEKLKFLLGIIGLNASKFAKVHLSGKISVSTFNKWVNGNSYPTPKNYSLIMQIETLLGLPAETLISTLPFHQSTIILNTEIAYRCRLKKLSIKKIRLWTQETEKEFRELVNFKTATILPSDLFRNTNSTWTVNEDQEIPSADILKGVRWSSYSAHKTLFAPHFIFNC